MIIGIGTDLVSIQRIEAVYHRFGHRFMTRILTDAERAQFYLTQKPAILLAKHFAAKEAAVKALGTGFRQGITWQGVSMTHTDLGAPQLRWFGKAKTRYQALGGVQTWLSLSDDLAYVFATVILERPHYLPS